MGQRCIRRVRNLWQEEVICGYESLTLQPGKNWNVTRYECYSSYCLLIWLYGGDPFFVVGSDRLWLCISAHRLFCHSFFPFYRDTMDPFDVSDTLLTENFMQLDRKMERYGSGKQILLPTSRREIGVVIVAMAVVYL